ncbi:MAG: DNA mismatch repair protein MutS [Deltaproteobacteria bacterium]|nr:DNA mismatch repair protein MutS [Deltaproteobacteria bacterium]
MALTPMLKQYHAIRETLSLDTVLFFRLGDFYEMFFEDARRASSILDITLTARDGGNRNKVPMCGVPFHAAQGYINRLTRAGLKVAICEQTEDPKLTKGLVKREVVRLLSPATNLEEEREAPQQCSYIAALYRSKKLWGCSYLDLGTGEFRVGEFAQVHDLEDELNRLQPRECVISQKSDLSAVNSFFKEHSPTINEYEDWIFDCEGARSRIAAQFKVSSLASLGLDDFSAGIAAAGALLYYLKDNLHKSLDHLKKPVAICDTTYMVLDRQTLRNLELVLPANADRRSPTLYSVLNQTITPMGGRLLAQWLSRPLVQPDMIRARLDAVEELFTNRDRLQALRSQLQPIKDIERLLARINCGTPSARDIVALGVSLKSIPGLKALLSSCSAQLITVQQNDLCELRELAGTIERALVDLPPPTLRDGGYIREGYSTELDDLRNISTNARDWVVALQRQEIDKTGIKSLKIKFNKVFGFYIEVTKTNLSMVPPHYQRKQTLVNAERFIIPELKEYEEKILGAEDKSRDLEQRLFLEIRTLVLKHITALQSTAHAVAILDVLASSAAVAIDHNFCKPMISDSPAIYITGARHPVVEHTLNGEPFIDNDILLDNAENQLLIITGPNMAGKSTYIRQAALLVLMAQAGSFVPARMAKIGVVDRIFSRIGASDNLARGESTFMVEMIETANILNNATSKSLLVFDEIGRGTSTFDGVSIAWSVCEYLNRSKFHPKCLFATHYHELTELTDHRPGLKNYNVAIKEIENNILFLRKVIPGSADRSYGIHVAKLAGLPDAIIERANEILLCLEEEKISEDSITEILKKKKGAASIYDLPLFSSLKPPDSAKAADVPAALPPPEHPLLHELKTLDVNHLTPLEALMKLAEWKKEME